MNESGASGDQGAPREEEVEVLDEGEVGEPPQQSRCDVQDDALSSSGEHGGDVPMGDAAPGMQAAEGGVQAAEGGVQAAEGDVQAAEDDVQAAEDDMHTTCAVDAEVNNDDASNGNFPPPCMEDAGFELRVASEPAQASMALCGVRLQNEEVSSEEASGQQGEQESEDDASSLDEMSSALGSGASCAPDMSEATPWGCQMLHAAGRVRFMCSSFQWRNSFVSSPLLITKKKLKTGQCSLRSSIKVMCDITGAPLQKHVVIRGPVYHVLDSLDAQHAVSLVMDHAVAILYRTYVRAVAALRSLAAGRGLLPHAYPEAEFDKTPAPKRVITPAIPFLPADARVQLAGNYEIKLHATKAEQELQAGVKVVSALKKAALESRCVPVSGKGCSVCGFGKTPTEFECKQHRACNTCTGAWVRVVRVWHGVDGERRGCPCCMDVIAPSPTKRQRVFEAVSSGDDGMHFLPSSDDESE